MEQINQLKKMRDEALARLQFNPDYKLLISLDRLIREIEQLVSDASRRDGNGFASTVPQATSKATNDIDAAFDKIASDLKDEVESANKPSDVNSDIKTAMSNSGEKAQTNSATK